jgi:superfamily II DNA or RNA helicase
LICKEEIKRGHSVALLTPREEIFNQSHSLFSEVCGKENIATLRSGSNWNRSKPIHIVSWPTLTARIKRSEAWLPDVHTVLVDECHLSVAPKIHAVLELLRPRSIIHGYTATPARQTGRGLGGYYTEIKHVTTVRQLINDGYLCPLEYWAGRAPDVKNLQIRRGDYEQAKLSERAIVLVGDVIDNWLRLAPDRHTLVFAVDIPHAEALTDRFLRAGVVTACLHSKLDTGTREAIVDKFRAGQTQVLVNVMIASYGFDVPAIDCVVLARPTKSLVLHLQCLGRGMRINEGKTECMVLDHADNVRRIGKADDLYRYTLDLGKTAAVNWSREKASGDKEKSQTHTCDICEHMFSGSRVCPNCGFEIPFAQRDIASTDDDLVRISEQITKPLGTGWPEHKDFYRMLVYHANSQAGIQKKDGWCAHKYKDRAGDWPDQKWRRLAGIPPTIRVQAWIDKARYDYIRQKKRGTKTQSA